MANKKTNSGSSSAKNSGSLTVATPAKKAGSGAGAKKTGLSKLSKVKKSK